MGDALAVLVGGTSVCAHQGDESPPGMGASDSAHSPLAAVVLAGLLVVLAEVVGLAVLLVDMMVDRVELLVALLALLVDREVLSVPLLVHVPQVEKLVDGALMVDGVVPRAAGLLVEQLVGGALLVDGVVLLDEQLVGGAVLLAELLVGVEVVLV